MADEGAGDPLADLRANLARRGDMRAAELADRLQADQARRWRAGRGLPAEDYRDLLPAAGGHADLIVQLILGEVLLRRERGERPDPAEYARRFPDLADVLAGHLELDRHLEAAGETVGLRDGPDPGPSTAGASDATADFDPPGAAGPVHPAPPPADGLARGAAVRYFGDYEIRKELGRGGMGVVYQARQVSLNRPVALKMIRAGVLADADELRRFQNEAEAVALLDHPGMVPIYEVGEHDGQHFFSMKLVTGGSLAPLLDRYRADPKAAATLAAEAAEAVAHAHARGVLHRDLKPANILVDGEGRPCITDFGLAKRVGADVESTASGAIAGTPAYMAPEQATGRRGGITTATDVYGLGAVLYALLTGKAPFGGDGVIETLDAVRTRPPEPPTRLNARVPRDLETICLKCLEKDPNRRYATAQALAEDLRGWLESRPIAARRVGVLERGWLWCKRRPAVAALVASVLLAAVLGTAAVIAVQTRANRLLARKNLDLEASNTRLNEQRARAEDREAQAIDAVKRFGDAVTKDPALKSNPALESLRKELLKEPLSFFKALRDRLQADRDTRPESLRRLGSAALDLARLTDEIGDQRDALVAYREALAIGQKLADDNPTVTDFQDLLGGSHHDIGVLLIRTGKPGEARTALERALAIYQKLADANPSVTHFQTMLVRGHNSLAGLLMFTGRPAEAMKAGESALAIIQKLADANPTVTQFQGLLATCHYNIGVQLEVTDPAGAIKAYERASAIYQKLAGANPTVTDHQVGLGRSYKGIGNARRNAGQWGEALTAYERGVPIFQKLADANPTVIAFQADLSQGYGGIGNVLGFTGKPAESLKAHESALAILQKLARDHPASPEFANSIGATLHNIALIDYEAKRFEAARDRLLQAIEWQRKALAPYPAEPAYRQFLGNHLTALTAAALRLGDPEGVAETERELAKLRESDPGTGSVDARLAAVMKGDRPPGDNAERLRLARRANDKALHATAAKLWAEALEADPRLGDDRQAQHRYDAACAAALAGWVKRKDDPSHAASERAELRGQAREWLRAELTAWARVFEADEPQARPLVVSTLEHWLQDADLAAIRDAKELAGLPEAERKGWESLWADVEALRKRAESGPPKAGRAQPN